MVALQSEGEQLCAALPAAEREALFSLVFSSSAPVPSFLREVSRQQLDEGLLELYQSGRRLALGLAPELREELLSTLSDSSVPIPALLWQAHSEVSAAEVLQRAVRCHQARAQTARRNPRPKGGPGGGRTGKSQRADAAARPAARKAAPWQQASAQDAGKASRERRDSAAARPWASAAAPGSSAVAPAKPAAAAARPPGALASTSSAAKGEFGGAGKGKPSTSPMAPTARGSSGDGVQGAHQRAAAGAERRQRAADKRPSPAAVGRALPHILPGNALGARDKAAAKAAARADAPPAATAAGKGGEGSERPGSSGSGPAADTDPRARAPRRARPAGQGAPPGCKASPAPSSRAVCAGAARPGGPAPAAGAARPLGERAPRPAPLVVGNLAVAGGLIAVPAASTRENDAQSFRRTKSDPTERWPRASGVLPWSPRRVTNVEVGRAESAPRSPFGFLRSHSATSPPRSASPGERSPAQAAGVSRTPLREAPAPGAALAAARSWGGVDAARLLRATQLRRRMSRGRVVMSEEVRMFATVTYPNGDVYEGGFAGGLRHGEGTYRFADGDVFAGSWVRGEKHGPGEYTWADGRRYIGAWRRNRQDGKGHFEWPSGHSYSGVWGKGIAPPSTPGGPLLGTTTALSTTRPQSALPSPALPSPLAPGLSRVARVYGAPPALGAASPASGDARPGTSASAGVPYLPPAIARSRPQTSPDRGAAPEPRSPARSPPKPFRRPGEGRASGAAADGPPFRGAGRGGGSPALDVADVKASAHGRGDAAFAIMLAAMGAAPPPRARRARTAAPAARALGAPDFCVEPHSGIYSYSDSPVSRKASRPAPNRASSETPKRAAPPPLAPAHAAPPPLAPVRPAKREPGAGIGPGARGGAPRLTHLAPATLCAGCTRSFVRRSPRSVSSPPLSSSRRHPRRPSLPRGTTASPRSARPRPRRAELAPRPVEQGSEPRRSPPRSATPGARPARLHHAVAATRIAAAGGAGAAEDAPGGAGARGAPPDLSLGPVLKAMMREMEAELLARGAGGGAGAHGAEEKPHAAPPQEVAAAGAEAAADAGAGSEGNARSAVEASGGGVSSQGAGEAEGGAGAGTGAAAPEAPAASAPGGAEGAGGAAIAAGADEPSAPAAQKVASPSKGLQGGGAPGLPGQGLASGGEWLQGQRAGGAQGGADAASSARSARPPVRDAMPLEPFHAMPRQGPSSSMCVAPSPLAEPGLLEGAARPLGAPPRGAPAHAPLTRRAAGRAGRRIRRRTRRRTRRTAGRDQRASSSISRAQSCRQPRPRPPAALFRRTRPAPESPARGALPLRARRGALVPQRLHALLEEHAMAASKDESSDLQVCPPLPPPPPLKKLGISYLIS